MRMTHQELARLEHFGPSVHGWSRLIAEVRACWAELGRKPGDVKRVEGQTHLHCHNCQQWHPVDFQSSTPLVCPTCGPIRRTT